MIFSWTEILSYHLSRVRSRRLRPLSIDGLVDSDTCNQRDRLWLHLRHDVLGAAGLETVVNSIVARAASSAKMAEDAWSSLDDDASSQERRTAWDTKRSASLDMSYVLWAANRVVAGRGARRASEAAVVVSMYALHVVCASQKTVHGPVGRDELSAQMRDVSSVMLAERDDD